MSRKIKIAAIALAAAFSTEASFASEQCVSRDELTPLKVAALQQKLMVAALTCHEIGAYNRFVLSYRPQLQRSDRAMLSVFLRHDGEHGDAQYNAYKTRLANLSMLRENSDSEGFCSEARSAFESALAHRASLVELVSSQSASDMPFDDCTADASDEGGGEKVAWHQSVFARSGEEDADRGSWNQSEDAEE
ncbi:MAG: hypothetical protein JOZ55_05655 [Alphaproteobacteria bacterium]|nr:hypothetical protein [Alphaproteobacteria bacterium]